MVCAERYSEEDKLFLIVAISNIAKFWREEYVRGHRGVACSELSPNIHHHLGYEMLPGVLSAMIVARFSRISPVQFRKSQYRVDVVKLSFKKKITWTNKLLHDCPLEFVHWSYYQFSNVCKTHCPLSLFWYRRLTLTLLSLSFCRFTRISEARTSKNTMFTLLSWIIPADRLSYDKLTFCNRPERNHLDRHWWNPSLV